MGANGITTYPASLQVKVAQISYAPSSEFEEQDRQTDKFLFVPESTHDYSVNNYPPGQLHAIDLGLMSDNETRSEVGSQPVASMTKATPAKKRGSQQPPTRRTKKSKVTPPPTYSPASPDPSVDDDSQWCLSDWLNKNIDASQQTRDPALWNDM